MYYEILVGAKLGKECCSTENTSENFGEMALLNMEAICLAKRGERLAADCILVPEIRS